MIDNKEFHPKECRACLGSGEDSDFRGEDCGLCDGMGYHPPFCYDCNDHGEQNGYPCPACTPSRGKLEAIYKRLKEER